MYRLSFASFLLTAACGHGGHGGDIEAPLASLCNAVETPIDAEEVSTLGFSAEDAMESLLGDFSISATDEEENPVTSAEISITRMDGQILLVEYVHPETGEPLEGEDGSCEKHLSVPAEMQFTTADGQFDFVAETTLKIDAAATGTIDTVHELEDNHGDYTPDMTGLDSGQYALNIQISPLSLGGELRLITEYSTSGPDGFIVATLTPLLMWSDSE